MVENVSRREFLGTLGGLSMVLLGVDKLNAGETKQRLVLPKDFEKKVDDWSYNDWKILTQSFERFGPKDRKIIAGNLREFLEDYENNTGNIHVSTIVRFHQKDGVNNDKIYAHVNAGSTGTNLGGSYQYLAVDYNDALSDRLGKVEFSDYQLACLVGTSSERKMVRKRTLELESGPYLKVPLNIAHTLLCKYVGSDNPREHYTRENTLGALIGNSSEVDKINGRKPRQAYLHGVFNPLYGAYGNPPLEMKV